MKARAVPGLLARGLAVLAAAAALAAATSSSASAQGTPAAGPTPPDDTPSIKAGATIFTDFTYQQKPQAKDADGNLVSPNSFNVSRSYVNITGNISHIVGFRITPDITRDTTTGSSTNGSLVFRIKYAFAQFSLDDWLPKGSYIRLGIQQTPYIDYEEGIYRYRFQGTLFPERTGYMSSSDAGVSFHAAIPDDYGDLHLGIYNGEGYSRVEANDQKALQIRGTLRPLPRHPLMRGFRVTGFYVADNYVAGAERKRAIFNFTYEHTYASAGFEYLDTKDQPSVTNADVHGKGWSLFVTPKFGKGFEGLARYDHLRRDVRLEAAEKRAVAGVAYWFPKQGNVNAALLFDVENVRFADYLPAQPIEQRIFVHCLIAF